MTSDNYIGLSVASGFFIGLIFAFLSFENPESVVLFALIVTAIFYLIIMTGISVFNRFSEFRAKNFNKQALESNLEYYVTQFEKREEELVRVLDYIRHIELEQEKRA